MSVDPASAVGGFTPAGIVKALAPWIVLLIVAVLVIVIIFGVKPTIGGLQL